MLRIINIKNGLFKDISLENLSLKDFSKIVEFYATLENYNYNKENYMKIFLIIVIIAFAFVKIVEFFEQKQKNIKELEKKTNYNNYKIII